MATPLITKYLPTVGTIIGREKEIAFITEFIKNYSKQKKKAVLLYGPCGTGKTSLVHAIAKEFGLELFELNASDVRNKDQILTRLEPAVKQRSFFSEGKIILLDEADGLSGNADRGGASEIANIIEQSIYPVILTANDLSDNLKSIVKLSTAIEFLPLTTQQVTQILRRISDEEKFNITDDVLFMIALANDGDVRGSINDLEMLSIYSPILKEHVKLLSERRKTVGIEQALRVVFKTTDAKTALSAFETCDEDINEQLLWIDYNLPFEYTQPLDLARAYGCISKAEVFLSRIRRNQEWHFLVYAGALLTAGIATSKSAPYKTVIEYKQTSRLLKIWQANMSNAKRKVIAHKLAVATHCSNREAFTQMDYLRIMCKNKSFLEKISSQLELDEEQVAWLVK